MALSAADLIAFERTIADDFEAGKIRAPVHLSGGNEEQLIELFRDVQPEDWVCTTYRNHYHALLHGVPPDLLRAEILAGKSMYFSSPEHRIISSAIVGGILPIAVGIAEALKRMGGKWRWVWAFVGDMAATTGIFHESLQFAEGHDLPITFIVEDNGMSTDTPTVKAWGKPAVSWDSWLRVRHYTYQRTWPHINTGKWVDF